MPFSQHTWSPGETITAALLNRVEAGLAAAAQPPATDSAREQYIPARLADATLRAALEPRELPAHAGARPHRFAPDGAIYNLKSANTRRLRAALAAARAGTGLCRLTFVGDSLTAGYQATRGTSDPVTFLRGELTRQGYATGELVVAYTNGAPDTRFAQSTGSAPTFPWGDLVSNATVTVTGTGTVLEVVGSGIGQAWTVSVDGGAPATFTPNGSSGPQVFTVTGLSNAAHSAVITGTTGGANNSYLHAAGFRQASGVVVENAGIVHNTTADWLAGAGAFGPAWSLFHTDYPGHDAVVIELGANNLLIPAGTVASFAADLATLVDQARAQTPANPATVLLTTSNYPSGHDTDWPPFLSAIYDVADAKDVPLIDFADRLGLFAAHGASQGSGDGIHLNAAGNAHKARAWWNALNA